MRMAEVEEKERKEVCADFPEFFGRILRSDHFKAYVFEWKKEDLDEAAEFYKVVMDAFERDCRCPIPESRKKVDEYTDLMKRRWYWRALRKLSEFERTARTELEKCTLR
jgi:hypothetical protein